MDPTECTKFDGCLKIEMILDKDILDSQYAEAIQGVCSKCDDPDRKIWAKEFTNRSEAEHFLKQTGEQNLDIRKITVEYER